MRAAVVGGGLAGAALAWRLTGLGARVTVFTGGGGPGPDATGASGGLVRAFEPDPEAGRLAAESLADLRGDPVLAAWAGYQQLSSTYVLPPEADPAAVRAALTVADDLVPGSARLVRGRDRAGLRGLPDGTVAVRERHAGYISPARLRGCLLAAAYAAGARHCPRPVTGIRPDPAVELADGVRRFDAVVLATGPWTPRLLADWGLGDQRLRTRQIQYTLGRARLPGLGAFVDETSGLYGRPVSSRLFLLGLPIDRWQVTPEEVTADRGLAHRVAPLAARRLGLTAWPGPGARTVTSLDCYAPHGGLRLRGCLPGVAVHTFTGGSGGAAKTALAAARRAAAELRGTR